jgi:CubicO group peptidase (beta-lactamase class C family)
MVDSIPKTNARFARAYEIVNRAVHEEIFPGCAFAVLADGKSLLSDAVGRFTYDPDARSVATSTLFDIASVTKVVATTAAAMLLHQRGQLDLELHLGELLPGFVVGREDSRLARRITLRHLLAHNSGLPGYVEFFRVAKTPAELLRKCLELPVEAEPGMRMEYSDPGFILLGKAIEVLVREPLNSWVAREIFKPLSMHSTGFNPPASLRTLIPPTEFDERLRHRVVQGDVQDENAFLLKGVAGHAGLFSNSYDLILFAKAILAARTKSEESTLFHSETVDLFAERQQPDGSSRALGWDTPSEESSAGKLFSAHSIGHLGYSGCSLWIDREAKVAIVLLSNRTWPNRSEQSQKGIKALRPAFHDAIREAL